MKANIAYASALVLGLAGLFSASGIENSATFSGMMAYFAGAIILWGLAILCMGIGSYFERQEYIRNIPRKSHRKDA